MNKIFNLLIIFLFISNCSTPDWLDTSRGIFGTGEEISKEVEIGGKKIFDDNEIYEKELNKDLKIKLKDNFIKNSFVNNLTNNNGLINFEKKLKQVSKYRFSKKDKLKKVSKYKFKKIRQFEFSQPELLITNRDSIVFFDNKGTILNFDQKSKIIWKKNIYLKKEKKNNPILYFAANNKILVVTDNFAKYYGINLTNGELIWSHTNSSPFNSQVKLYKNKFFTVDSENILRCFSLNDGKELWNFKTENSFIKSQQKLSLIISNNRVVFINTLGDVSSIDINNGNLLWQTPTQSSEIYESSFSLQNSDLIAAKKNIFFSNNKNQFFALDERTGDIIWTQSINSNLRPTYIQGLIFTISLEGYLVVIDARNGNIVRMTNIFGKIKNYEKKGFFAERKYIKPVGFIVSKDKIYTSLNNGRIIIADILTGKPLEVVKIDSEKISRPYIFNNEMFVIRDNAILKLN